MKTITFRHAALLVTACLIYASTGFFIKSAANHLGVNPAFFSFFFSLIACLGVYAILWQKILGVLPLGVAYLSKSMTIILALVISHCVFGETITLNNILGTGLILLGLINLYAPRR
jgi:drug/metabolite transporter (DMT)-like permease